MFRRLDIATELRNKLDEAYGAIARYQREIALVNRAIRRRNKVNREQRAKIKALTDAAINLRKAQRAYMADRGNDAFGNEVARATMNLDALLPPYTAEDKRLAALCRYADSHHQRAAMSPPDPPYPGSPVGCPILD